MFCGIVRINFFGVLTDEYLFINIQLRCDAYAEWLNNNLVLVWLHCTYLSVIQQNPIQVFVQHSNDFLFSTFKITGKGFVILKKKFSNSQLFLEALFYLICNPMLKQKCLYTIYMATWLPNCIKSRSKKLHFPVKMAAPAKHSLSHIKYNISIFPLQHNLSFNIVCWWCAGTAGHEELQALDPHCCLRARSSINKCTHKTSITTVSI